MTNLLKNKTGEGYIKTAMAVVIAVVIGAIIVAGCYFIFTSNLEKTDEHLDSMVNMGNSISVIRQTVNGVSVPQYSYDGETWRTPSIPGFNETSSVTNLIETGQGDNVIWFISFSNSSSKYVYRSFDGINWSPLFSDYNGITISKTGSIIKVNCYDGRSYQSTDGINFTLTTTKMY